MRRSTFAAILLLSVVFAAAPPVHAQQRETYDTWAFQREMSQRGVQAVLMCNGLFTSNRTLEQVFAQELRYLRQPIGTAAGGDYEVDRAAPRGGRRRARSRAHHAGRVPRGDRLRRHGAGPDLR